MSTPLPPATRGPLGRRFTEAVARGALELPVCDDCGRLQYPPREACGHCLSPSLTWQAMQLTGELLAATTLQHSNEAYFAERLPRRVGLVRIADGAQAVVHLVDDSKPGAVVGVRAMLDRSAQGVLVAHAVGGAMNARYRDEFTSPA